MNAGADRQRGGRDLRGDGSAVREGSVKPWNVFRGRGAKDAIVGRLEGRPEAAGLAARICDFYGDALQYREDAALESSRYAIDLQHEPVALRAVRIELLLGTRRTTEALLHELLHLGIPMQGYPMGERFWMPDELGSYAHYVTSVHPIVGNLLEHELMIDSFLDLGFTKENFLGCLSPPPDYEGLASGVWPTLCCREDIGFSWWCLEYFRHWVSMRHSAEDEAEAYADRALYWGSRVYPGLGRTAKQIRKLIESEALRDSTRYPFHVNELLRFMKLPTLTGWATLLPGKGRPRAASVAQAGKPARCPAPMDGIGLRQNSPGLS